MSAQYTEASDSFCLKLDEFALVKSDLEDGVSFCEKRLTIERRAWQDHIIEIQRAHDDVHSGYISQRDKLKADLTKTHEEIDRLKVELWWWRVGLVGVLSVGALSAAYLLSY